MIAGYIKVENLDQALQALDQNQPVARILAGGTDIMQKTRAIRRNKTNDLVFVDIKDIKEFKSISREDDNLLIGPAVTLDELIRSEIIADAAPDLILAAGYVGSPELRNRATVGGNICSKNPAADLLVPLAALDASIEVCDITGRRDVPVAEIIGDRLKGFGRRMVISKIKVPTGQSLATGYRRWTRETMGRAYLTVMVNIKDTTDTDEYQLKVVIAGAGMWPRSFEEVLSISKLLSGNERTDLIKQIVQEKLGSADPDAYRMQLTRVLLDEALDIAVKGVNQ